MKTTINDIAKIAGVSISTVSRVINNSKPVKDEIRNRVLAAMEQTKYRPSAFARGLVKSESYLLGVMVPEFRDTVLDDMINGMNHVSKLYGYNTLLSQTGGSVENELHYVNLFRDIQADGIIINSESLKDELIELIELAGIPCILIGRDPRSSTIPSVHIDNFSAAYEAVTYLIREGHRNIAMIRTRLSDVASGYYRYKGYRQALADAGIAFSDHWEMESGISIEDGMKAMEKIAGAGPLPTAVFCATDRMAIGAMNYLLENGFRVPEDVSVFGFDGIDMSLVVRPKLSTVKYSALEIGMAAARNLIKMIKGERVDPLHWCIPHHLEIRESVRRI